MTFRIEHRLGVPASAAAVWEVLKDLESWPQWTSLYPEIRGALRIGGMIMVVEQVGDAPPAPHQPTIADWEPNSQILWKAKANFGLLRRTRYFEVEGLTDTGCIVSNGEVYDGYASRYVTRQHRRALYLAFEAFNAALRDRALAQA